MVGGLRSEDTGVLAVQWDEGVPGVVEVLGVTDGESYEAVVHTSAGEHRVVLTGGQRPEVALGYRATMDALLRMVAGAASPVPWEHRVGALGAHRGPGTAHRSGAVVGACGTRWPSLITVATA